MPDEMTVSQAVEKLERAGFDSTFRVVAGGVRCAECGHTHVPADLEVTYVFRYEGESDPGDESIVLGVECAGCDRRGVLTAAYGPAASAEEAEVIAAIPLRSGWHAP